MIFLNDIIQTLVIKIETVNEDSLRRSMIQFNERMTEEEKASKLKELDTQWKLFNLYHDVLETVASHTSEINRTYFVKEKRTWENEWDIPLDVFNTAIDESVATLISYDERRQKKDAFHSDKIELLNKLKAFRNKKESQIDKGDM